MQDFAQRFAGVYELSPWVAERAARDGVPDDPATAMRAVVDAASRGRQLALLRAHPDLAGRLAVTGNLTQHSSAEQEGAGLDRCTPGEFAEFQDLNACYREKFVFPFILAVRGHDRASILAAFRRRIGNDAETEFREALGQVHRIAAHRISDLVEDTAMTDYAGPAAGLPPQTALMTQRAVFTEAYAVIPRGTMRDIVTSLFPGWHGARGWMLARPLTGFAETFAQIIMEVAPGGGSDTPEPDPDAQAVLFVTRGGLALTIDGQQHDLGPGGYAYLPPGIAWTIANARTTPVQFHWVRKAYRRAPGLDVPPAFVTNEQDHAPIAMPDTAGRWATTRFVEPDDLRHDMHVNIVTLEPGGTIPFEETHVMEHGLYVLEGKAVYRLNRDWVEVEAGDFMWLRAFCPQACYAGGPGRFRYLLYKDVNRHPDLRLP